MPLIIFFHCRGSEDALALQHEGQDVTSVLGVGVIFLDHALEQDDGGLFWGDLRLGFSDVLFVNALPVGERGAFGEFLLPRFMADIPAGELASGRVEVDGCVVLLAFLKGSVGDGAVVGARADVPVLLHGY